MKLLFMGMQILYKISEELLLKEQVYDVRLAAVYLLEKLWLCISKSIKHINM